MLLTKNKIHFGKKANGLFALGWGNIIAARFSTSYGDSTYQRHTTTNSIQTNFDATAAFTQCHSSIVRYILLRQESTDSTSVASAGCVLKHDKSYIVHTLCCSVESMDCRLSCIYHRMRTRRTHRRACSLRRRSSIIIVIIFIYWTNEMNYVYLWGTATHERFGLIMPMYVSNGRVVAFVFKWWVCHFLVPFWLTAVRHHVSQDGNYHNSLVDDADLEPASGCTDTTNTYTINGALYHNQISVMNFCVRHRK